MTDENRDSSAAGGESDAGLHLITESSVLKALSLVRRGRMYSLESRWWRGMPGHPAHPRFEVLTYRSPRGEQNQRDHQWLLGEANAVNFGFISDLIMGTAHTGTHIDALCHTTCGQRAEWHGGYSSYDYLGDFGALNSDAAALGPIITRGVMLDIPRALGVQCCSAGYSIGREDLQRAAEAQGVELRRGDVVLVRTGQMQFWPDTEALEAVGSSGVSMDGAEWLLQHGPVAVGADNVAFESEPSAVEGNPQPVHVYLIHKHGTPILEWVNCEQLAAEEVYEFAFVCLPLTVMGATASMVRPIAIA